MLRLVTLLTTACLLAACGGPPAEPETMPATTAEDTTRQALPAVKTVPVDLADSTARVQVELYDDPALPFLTYLPPNAFKVVHGTSTEGTGARFFSDVGDCVNFDAFVHVFVPRRDLGIETLAHMEAFLLGRDGVAASNGWNLLEVDSTGTSALCPWAERTYTFDVPGASPLDGSICLGRQNGRPFYVTTQVPGSVDERFPAYAALIRSELHWRGAAEGLPE